MDRQVSSAITVQVVGQLLLRQNIVHKTCLTRPVVDMIETCLKGDLHQV